MTITAQDILTELGNRAWSGFNLDDMIFTSDDSAQARTEVNAALRYLLGLRDFPFKSASEDVMAMSGMSDYSSVVGQITKIYDTDTLEELEYIGDSSDYDTTKTGKPTGYWVEYNNPDYTIRLYPIPDDTYNLKIVYNQYMPVLSADGDLKFLFDAEDDYINMPSNLEYLFMDCLIMRTMQTNNKDDQDENYAPTTEEFYEAWRNFCRLAKPIKKAVRVVW